MKIGIFGGTFNPPHNGHLLLLKRMQKALRLDKMIVIPSNMPPHKDVTDNNPEHRMNMTKLAFPEYSVSDIEIKRGGKSYTYETLEELRSIYPQDKMYFICGSDMFLTFDEWKCPERIFKAAIVVTSARCYHEYPSLIKKKLFLKKKYGAKTRIIYFKPYVMSSTQIRDMAKNGDDLSGAVPDNVAAYIEENGLYK